MSFSLYCLMSSELNSLSLKVIEQQLKYRFSKTSNFRIEYEEDPFDPLEKRLLLSWGKWWIRVFFDVGLNVLEYSKELSKYANAEDIDKLSKADISIRVLFYDDDEKEFTDESVIMLDYLESFSEVLTFNPNNNSFVSF
jgi:hypothetical protein